MPAATTLIRWGFVAGSALLGIAADFIKDRQNRKSNNEQIDKTLTACFEKMISKDESKPE